MKKNLLFLSCAFMLVLALDASATKHTINVMDFSFSPNALNVVEGDTVVWVWQSGSHTTTSTSVPAGAATWDSPITSTNPTFEYKITAPGTYTYVCTPHSSQMSGTIVAAPSTGISKYVGSSRVQLFPNPVKNVLKVSIDAAKSSEVKLTVFDVLGKEVVNESIEYTIGRDQYFLPVSMLTPGLYMVSVKVGDEKPETFKIHKQ